MSHGLRQILISMLDQFDGRIQSVAIFPVLAQLYLVFQMNDVDFNTFNCFEHEFDGRNALLPLRFLWLHALNQATSFDKSILR